MVRLLWIGVLFYLTKVYFTLIFFHVSARLVVRSLLLVHRFYLARVFFVSFFDGVFAVAIWFGVYVRNKYLASKTYAMFSAAPSYQMTQFIFMARTHEHIHIKCGDMEHRARTSVTMKTT